MTETGKFLEQAPNLYSGFSEEFQEVEHNLRSIIKELPDNVQVSIDNTLTPREKEIICLRYGIGRKDGREMTQKEVADLLGISQSYISRLEKKIMVRLKKSIQNNV